MAIFCKYKDQIKKHFIDNGANGDLEALLRQAGANSTEASRINKTLSKRFKAMAKDDMNKLYAGLMKDPKIKKESKRFQKLLEDAIEGKVRAGDVDNAMAEAFGLPGISKAKAEKIAQLAKEVQSLKSNPGVNRNKIIEATAKLEQEIAETTPSNFLQKADTYTTANLLLNPKTIERNLISNEFELLGQQFESLLRGSYKASDAKLLNEIRVNSFKEIMDDISKGIRTRNVQGSELYGAGMARTFRPEELAKSKNKLAQGFERLGALQEKGLRYALEAHDVVVRDMSLARSIMDGLRGEKALKGVEFKTQKDFDSFLKRLDEGKIKGITEERWKEIKHYAEWESAKTVLQDDSSLSRIASSLGRLGDKLDDKPWAQNLYKFMLGTLLKFSKTPSNIIMRVLERDVLTGTALSFSRYASGKMSGAQTDYFLKRQLVAGLTRSLVGPFGLGGAGYIMSEMGILVPEGYKDSQVVKIGDLNFNIAPFAIFLPQLAAGSELQQQFERDNKASIEGVFSAYGKNWQNLTAAILDTPVLTGAKKLVQTAEDFSKNPDEQKRRLAELIVNGGTQWLPFVSMMRGLAKGIDDKERDTYSKEGFKKAIKYAISNIPGLRQTLPEKIDTAGRPVKPVSENIALRTLDAIFNPAVTRRSVTSDPVFKELRELRYMEVRSKDKFKYAPNTLRQSGKSYKLSDEQKRTYQKQFGNYTYDRVKALIATPAYVTKNPDDRQEMIAKIEREGRQFAKQQILGNVY